MQDRGITSAQSSLLALLAVLYYLVQAISSPIPGVYWGELVLLAAAAMGLVWNRSMVLRIHAVHVCLFVLYISFVVITLATACFQPTFSLYDFVIRAIRWSVYVFCGAVLASRIDFLKLRKYTITIAVLLAALLIVQVLVHRFTGQVLSLQVGTKLLGCSVERRSLSGGGVSRIYRFSAVFSEPAHFAYYVAIGLALLLFYRSDDGFNPGELLAAGVLVLSMVLSTSTYGLGLLAIICLIYLYYYLRKTRNAGYAFLVVIGIAFAFGIVLVGVRDTSVYHYLMTKLSSFGTTNRTTFIWQSNLEFPRLLTCLGCGVGNEQYYFQHYFNSILPYINSISMAFLYCGIVGIVLTMLFFLVSWCFCGRNARIMLVIFFAMALFSTAFFGPLVSLLGTIMVAGEHWAASNTGGEV